MEIILKQNTPEIIEKIKQAGIDVCRCTSFTNAVWLEYMGINGVHGVGYSDETEPMSVDEALKLFLTDCKNPIFCKDVEEFINKIKNYENY